jgi:tRNA-splicing ligase RtcB
MNEIALERVAPSEWVLQKYGEMRVPGRIIAGEETIAQLKQDLAEKKAWNALEQVRNVACLPGIVSAALALPDVHPGYGFPIGGVAAFDIEEGVVVVGGVGFDINEGKLRLNVKEIDRLLREGARNVVERGYGSERDLLFIEEEGRVADADPLTVSLLAKQRQFKQVGTLGSGNHYLEVQTVERVFDQEAAAIYSLAEGQVVVSIHTGSRALGHQICQDYLKEMERASQHYQIPIRERELVCAPVASPEGRRYLSAVACGSNCAFANRQVIAHLVRTSFARILDLTAEAIRTVYDIGHNNVKFERHRVDGEERTLLVHRKGSTRAFGPGRKESPAPYRAVGHPILVGGTMGTASYVMCGTELGMEKTFGSGIHGAGRVMSRKKAAKKYWGKDVEASMANAGIILRAHSMRGIAEEAPGAYKDVERVVQAAIDAGINRLVARLRPLLVIKG